MYLDLCPWRENTLERDIKVKGQVRLQVVVRLIATGRSQRVVGHGRVGRASGNLFTATVNPLANMAPETLAPAGGDQPHNNMQPYLTFYFNIALQGVFPPRT